MPKNGYWIECIPLHSVNSEHVQIFQLQNLGNLGQNQNMAEDLYGAATESFPDLVVTAPSPDKAIEKLRDRLRCVRKDYEMTGKVLPALDNPVRPPQRLRQVQGWISVYVDITTICGSGQ
jgi:hypothetical protein